MAAVVGVAQLAQHARLDLADTLAGDAELAPDLFKRAILPIAKSIAQLDDPPLALGQFLQHHLELLAQNMLRRAIDWRRADLILDKVAQYRVALGADRRFERDRLARNL